MVVLLFTLINLLVVPSSLMLYTHHNEMTANKCRYVVETAGCNWKHDVFKAQCCFFFMSLVAAAEGTFGERGLAKKFCHGEADT